MLLNCWEFMKCGKASKSQSDLCPAATEVMADKLNRGKNGGRMCWAVAGTHCHGGIQGAYAEKILLCSDCDFRTKVLEEERAGFQRIYFKGNETARLIMTVPPKNGQG
ncbi:MAG: two-CW domain-containing protein [Thermodesulfovibrionales bacterium]